MTPTRWMGVHRHSGQNERIGGSQSMMPPAGAEVTWQAWSKTLLGLLSRLPQLMGKLSLICSREQYDLKGGFDDSTQGTLCGKQSREWTGWSSL